MKILITGITGLLGRSLLGILSHAEGSFYCVVRNKEKLETLKVPSNCHLIYQDLSETIDFNTLPDNIDVVIHLAQSPNYKEFPGSSQEVLFLNTVITHKLMEYARKANAKQFIFTSTGSVYEGDYSNTKESSFVHPQSFYSSTKYASEVLLNSYRSFFDICILRLFFLYGPLQREDRLIQNLTTKIRNGQLIKVEGEKGLVFTPTYSLDVARLIFEAVYKNWAGCINIATPEAISILDAVKEIGNIIGIDPIVNHTNNNTVTSIVPNTKKLQKISPQFTFSKFRDGLEETLRLKSSKNF